MVSFLDPLMGSLDRMRQSPDFQSALMAAGLRMMQTPQYGDNILAQLGQGGQAALAQVSQNKQLRAEAEQQALENTMRQQELELRRGDQDRLLKMLGLQTLETNANIANMTRDDERDAEQFGQTHTLDEAKLARQEAADKESARIRDEANAIKRISAMASAARASGGGTMKPDTAARILAQAKADGEWLRPEDPDSYVEEVRALINIPASVPASTAGADIALPAATPAPAPPPAPAATGGGTPAPVPAASPSPGPGKVPVSLLQQQDARFGSFVENARKGLASPDPKVRAEAQAAVDLVKTRLVDPSRLDALLFAPPGGQR